MIGAIAGTTVAGVACIVCVVIIIVGVVWLVRDCHKRRRRRARAVNTHRSTEAETEVEAEEPPRRRHKRVYAGVPIYPTTEVADGDEVVFVPDLEDIPEAAPAHMPRTNYRIIHLTTPVESQEAPAATERRHRRSLADAAVPSTSPVVTNPLDPSTVAAADTEVCVGVVVPELTEEARAQAEGRWYTQREYGSAVYYNDPPAEAESAAEGSAVEVEAALKESEEKPNTESGGETHEQSLTMSDLE